MPASLYPTDVPRPWRLAPVDPGRLIRALRCVITNRMVTPEGTEAFEVFDPSSPGEEKHWVGFDEEAHEVCSCEDHAARELLCKHMLAVLLFEEQNDRARIALADLVCRAAQQRKLVLGIVGGALSVESK